MNSFNSAINYKEIGAQMKEVRKKSGDSQTQTANKLCVSARHYGNMERGRVAINLDYINAFSKIYGVELINFLVKTSIHNKHDLIAVINAKLSKYSIDNVRKILEFMKLMEG